MSGRVLWIEIIKLPIAIVGMVIAGVIVWFLTVGMLSTPPPEEPNPPIVDAPTSPKSKPVGDVPSKRPPDPVGACINGKQVITHGRVQSIRDC